MYLLKIFMKIFHENVHERFDKSNYDKNTNGPITTGINKKVLIMFKDELGNDIMTESTNVRAKLNAFEKQDSNEKISENKKAKGTKKCITKKELIHKDFKDAIFNNKIKICKQQTFRSYNHIAFTEEIDKIAISPNDDQRIRINNNATMTYQYGSPTAEMLIND